MTSHNYEVDVKWDGGSRKKPTHQVDAVYLWVLLNIFGNSTIFHPSTNDLEWWYLGGNTEKGNDIGML